MTEEEGIVIGIDVGTTTTSAAVLKNGRYDILKMGNGDLTIDSVVNYNHSSKSVGFFLKGKNQSRGTVYEVKRILGTKFENMIEEINRNNWSYTVFEGEDGMSTIELSIVSKGETFTKIVTPVDVYADILSSIREFAQKFVGKDTFSSCVLTCPVDFSLRQRQAIQSACVLADLSPVYLISEPTAAAIAFAEKFDKESTGVRHYLVYDFGGGTFDASVVCREGDQYTVMKTKGDAHLGGKDIDVALIREVKSYLESGDRTISPRETLNLKIACKEAKEQLLTQSSIEIFTEFEDGSEDSYMLTQMTLARIAQPIVQKTVAVVREVLTTCEPPLTPGDIDRVFLMGGSSCLATVAEELRTLFPPEKLCSDTAELSRVGIALGAARVAACRGLRNGRNVLSMEGDVEDGERNRNGSENVIQLRDVSSYSVRILCGNETRAVVPAQTPLREEHSIRLIPLMESAKFARVVVTVGETEQLEENTVIGVLSVPISQKRRPEEQPLLVRIHVEEDDRVDVIVENELSNRSFHVVLQAGLNDALLARLQVGKERRDEEEAKLSRLDGIRQDIFVMCSGNLSRLDPETAKQVRQINADVAGHRYSEEELERIRQRLVSLLHSSRVCFQ